MLKPGRVIKRCLGGRKRDMRARARKGIMMWRRMCDVSEVMEKDEELIKVK